MKFHSDVKSLLLFFCRKRNFHSQQNGNYLSQRSRSAAICDRFVFLSCLVDPLLGSVTFLHLSSANIFCYRWVYLWEFKTKTKKHQQKATHFFAPRFHNLHRRDETCVKRTTSRALAYSTSRAKSLAFFTTKRTYPRRKLPGFNCLVFIIASSHQRVLLRVELHKLACKSCESLNSTKAGNTVSFKLGTVIWVACEAIYLYVCGGEMQPIRIDIIMLHHLALCAAVCSDFLAHWLESFQLFLVRASKLTINGNHQWWVRVCDFIHRVRLWLLILCCSPDG